MVAHRISTLAEVARIAVQEDELSLPLRDFLDGFQSEPGAWKLTEEPERVSPFLKDDGFADAYLAAVCDHLSRRHRLPRPDWIFAKDRTLQFPHFAAKTHALRMILLQESPPAFRERNIFVSANALSRC
ncbi:MAG: hypothetical protein ACKOAS_06645 [Verrucomicrobiota bacterium]|jgi:hypothetical protein